MKGKEQHLQLPYSLTSTYCSCNSHSASPLARIVLAGHKAQGKTMARAMDRVYVAGLHRVTLQSFYREYGSLAPAHCQLFSAHILP